MKRLLVAVLVVVVGPLVAWAPAAEAASGSVTGINGVLYDDCLDYPYRYQVLVPEGAMTWYLEAAAYGPDGRVVDTDRVDQPSGTGESTFSLCPEYGYGAYTIRATFKWSFSPPPSAPSSEPFADAHFTMRKPFTRTALSVSTRRPAYGQRVVCRIRAFDERPTGYFPTSFTWVHLEKRQDGRWVRVKGSRALTHEDGRIRVRVRYLRRHHHPQRIRAVTEPAPKLRRSVSPVVRLW